MGSMTRLIDRNPHRVHVSDYLERLSRGLMPRPEKLGVDSWVVGRPASRTFGFKTEDEAKAFKAKWVLKE